MYDGLKKSPSSLFTLQIGARPFGALHLGVLPFIWLIFASLIIGCELNEDILDGSLQIDPPQLKISEPAAGQSSVTAEITLHFVGNSSTTIEIVDAVLTEDDIPPKSQLPLKTSSHRNLA